MEEALFGIDSSSTRRQFKTLRKRFSSTKGTLSTGTTVPAATGTLACKFCCIECHHYFRLEDSIFDFNRAIELDPTNPIIYSNRGLVYRKMDQFESAIEDYSFEI